MPNKTWKQVERDVCRYLGCERQRQDGSSSSDCYCHNGKIAVQVKHRENLPEWLLDMVLQSLGQAHTGEFPLLVLHPKGESCEDSLVILRLREARKLLVLAGLVRAIIEPTTQGGGEDGVVL